MSCQGAPRYTREKVSVIAGKQLASRSGASVAVIHGRPYGEQSLPNQVMYMLSFVDMNKKRLDAIQALLDELQGELLA
ncbi:hypothetical protein CRX42_05835 [Pseudomonas jessenii]|jgi:hypothetical protein|uniref:Uncharacterized protein n=1 Tax=Pseudomonas jessenii TaxID=77298 RepID=A0A2W0ESZ2_PSEJE|nr:hypothetical protein CRX42_05835 [Pseudomonas jessenii]